MPTSKADKGVKYSPWLTLRFDSWEDGKLREFCCNGRLLDFFDLKPASRGMAQQVRFRVSSERLGNDYEIDNSRFDLPLYCGIVTSKGTEIVMLYRPLGLMLSAGCWVGLESREVPNG